MENTSGYKILDGEVPEPEKVNAAIAEISMDELNGFRQSISSLGLETLGWGPACDELFNQGLNLSEDTYLQSLLSPTSYENAKVLLKQVVVFMQNPKQLPFVWAGRGRIYIYKAIDTPLNVENGFFRIIEGSPLMTLDEVKKIPPTDITLLPGQTIIMDGDLVMQYSKTGGGLGLLKCISKSGKEA